MFCMVTLIASCIHVYSLGYMHGELHEVTDHWPAWRRPAARRRGRFYRFFQYLSLFCFSMLGLVIAGNLAMVFVFWELVGICSYLLIGFYIERKSASNAANKAFIVNRVGDFGMIVGLMAILARHGHVLVRRLRYDGGPCGDLQPGPTGENVITIEAGKLNGEDRRCRAARTRPRVPDGMVRLAARAKVTVVGRHCGRYQASGRFKFRR